MFSSLDSQLIPGDTNNGHNVFVRDLKTGALRRIDMTNPAAWATYPSLSADNRHVAFIASDPDDPGQDAQVYVHDLRTGRTVLASPDVQGGKSQYSPSFPVLDRHGRTVAFSSYAYDLVPGDSFDSQHVYVRYLR
ncbi:TolB family protein [Streptomyces sp. NPDC002577]